MDKSISAVIPVYNRKEELIRAIDSIQAQTLKPTEIIIVDDCSPFSVEEFLCERNYLTDGLRVIRNPVNQGPSGARNVGVMNAKYAFVAFLDSDDYWHPSKLETQMQFFLDNPELDLVYSNNWIVYTDKVVSSTARLYKDNLWECLVNDCWTPPNPSTMLVRAEKIQGLQAFDASLTHAEDIDLWMRMSLQNMKIDYFPEPLTYFTFNSTGRLSKQYHSKFKKVEPFFSKWEPYFRQRGELGLFKSFKKKSFTKFAIESFVDSIRDRNLSVPLSMYFKYLWHQKDFYSLIFYKFFNFQSSRH